MKDVAKRPTFWSDYYSEFALKDIYWLDLSNENVHAQIISQALEAAGPVFSQRCLDVGCGKGQLSRCLEALQASEITGVDIVEKFIKENQKRNPNINWICDNLTKKSFYKSLGTFNVIFLVEVLQYLPIKETVQTFFDNLVPNGRLVGIIPNIECPIVTKAMERFNGKYIPISPNDLKKIFLSIPNLDCWLIRGLHFMEDQCILPYQPTPWTTTPEWNKPPNRLVFVLKKKGIDN